MKLLLLCILESINIIKIVLHLISNMISGLTNKANRAYQRVTRDIEQTVKSYFHYPEQIEECQVPLSPLLFKNDQPVDSKIKYNEDHSIATRIGEDYRHAFVNLRNTLTSNEFILIQILKVDLGRVGGLKLFLEPNSNGGRKMLFADSSSQPYDRIIFWMNEKGVLFCEKYGRIQSLNEINLNEAKDHKLVCEMYGPVQQIRVFMGNLNIAEENGSNLQRARPEEPKSNGVFLSMKIHRKHWVEEMTVNNLPTTFHSASNSSAMCSDSNGTSNNAVETCNICMDVDADTVIIPCGHLVCCYECASRVSTRCGSLCPICRTEINTCYKVHSRNSKCKQCEMDPANVVLLPCGDMCLCDSCSTIAEKCPICQMFVNGCQKVV